MSVRPTVGSLFAGIGGFDLGLERAGFDVRWQVEIDPWCRKVLAKHWPNVARFEDVRNCGKHNLEPVDLICGGFPCQPHSLAGKRKASVDERDLWPEFARIIRELKPGWVVAENVPGLLSSETGRFYGRVLRDLAKSGYDAEWQVLSAAAFGAPHIRERVWILAHANGGRCTEPDICREQSGRAEAICAGEDVADAESKRRGTRRESDAAEGTQRREPDRGGIERTVSYSDHQRCEKQRSAPAGSARVFTHFEHRSQWEPEPGVGRVVDGLPHRVDRLRGLGNAVVPQIVEWIGRALIDYLEAQQ